MFQCLAHYLKCLPVSHSLPNPQCYLSLLYSVALNPSLEKLRSLELRLPQLVSLRSGSRFWLDTRQALNMCLCMEVWISTILTLPSQPPPGLSLLLRSRATVKESPTFPKWITHQAHLYSIHYTVSPQGQLHLCPCSTLEARLCWAASVLFSSP